MRHARDQHRFALGTSALVVSIAALGTALALGLTGCPGDAGGGCRELRGCESLGCCNAENVCLERVCQGVGYICSVDSDGVAAWVQSVAACDDDDPCTEGDVCVEGKCQGTRAACESPPSNTCKDNRTLISYGASGKCSPDGCTYPKTELVCPKGCSGGKCLGDPCRGVDCSKPPTTCQDKGTCDKTTGKCRYANKREGSSCKPSDACVTGGECNASGKCVGTKISCDAPHTSGGVCVKGACQGYKCKSGWGNCNSKWKDGCETKLDTTSNCGACKRSCSAGAHATARCSNGSCALTCTSPWKDCNKTASDGCEIPVGLANRCDISGLNSSTGCGTAYCGSSSKSGAKNFGSWTCVFCTQCHQWTDGYSWCLKGSGQFSTARCSSCCAAADRDKICAK